MFLDPLLVILNASVPIPINISPSFGPPAATAAGTGLPIDVGSITGLAGMASAAYAFIKNHMDDKKQDQRTDALANSQLSTADSLKLTDLGVNENVNTLRLLVQTLTKNPDLNKLLTETQSSGALKADSVLDLIKDQASGWDDSIKKYYENTTRNNNEFAKDPVLNKTATVSNQTTPASQ